LAQQRRINAVVQHQDVAAKLTHAFNLGLSTRLQLAVGNALDTLRRQSQQGQLSTRRIEDRFCRSEVFQETSRHAWPYAGSHVEGDPVFHCRFPIANCRFTSLPIADFLSTGRAKLLRSGKETKTQGQDPTRRCLSVSSVGHSGFPVPRHALFLKFPVYFYKL